MIESLYRNNNGNMKISFRNDSQYNKDIIGLPIIKDNSPVGVIIDVDDREVKGVVWNRCMPIITEMYEGKVSSFEIVKASTEQIEEDVLRTRMGLNLQEQDGE